MPEPHRHVLRSNRQTPHGYAFISSPIIHFLCHGPNSALPSYQTPTPFFPPVSLLYSISTGGLPAGSSDSFPALCQNGFRSRPFWPGISLASLYFDGIFVTPSSSCCPSRLRRKRIRKKASAAIRSAATPRPAAKPVEFSFELETAGIADEEEEGAAETPAAVAVEPPLVPRCRTSTTASHKTRNTRTHPSDSRRGPIAHQCRETEPRARDNIPRLGRTADHCNGGGLRRAELSCVTSG